MPGSEPKKFVDIIKNWYAENEIETCENFEDENDEITFESHTYILSGFQT